jgi:hypothetical protein
MPGTQAGSVTGHGITTVQTLRLNGYSASHDTQESALREAIADIQRGEYPTGGRPVARPANWISGILDCPGCGGKLYIHTGLTVGGNPRTPKLACMGTARDGASCRQFTPVAAQPVIDVIAHVRRRRADGRRHVERE